MKKVLFLSPLPPPDYGSALSSQMCLDILKKSRNFEVVNIKLNYSKKMSDIGRLNFEKIKGFFNVKKQIKEKINNFKPDIVYFMPATSGFGLFRDFFFVKEIKKYFTKKILFHIRTRITEKDWNSSIKRKIITSMFKDQKAIILGEELKEDLRNLINEEDIFILPNAIKNELSTKNFQSVIKERKLNKVFEILFISNMERSKGWPKVLEACKILRNEKINFNCNFVGEWLSKKDELFFNDFVKKNNLDKNVFSNGKKIGKEKFKFFEIADVLVFPTEYPLETFGRVIVEAMMFGVPVIANRIATIPSIIEDNKTGFLLNENTPKEIAEKIKKLYFNKKLREKMILRSRKRFLRFFEIKEYSRKFIRILEKS